MNLTSKEIADFRKRIEVYSLSEDFSQDKVLPQDVQEILKKLSLDVQLDSPYALENTFLVALDLLEGLAKKH